MEVKTKQVLLKIPNGQKEATWLNPLEDGFILGVEAVSNHTDIDNMAEIGMFDDSSGAIADFAHLEHWKRRAGAGYNESYKPLLIETRSRTFNLRAKTAVNVQKDTYFTLIFTYRVPPPKC